MLFAQSGRVLRSIPRIDLVQVETPKTTRQILVIFINTPVLNCGKIQIGRGK